MYSSERRREIRNLIHDFKTVEGLAEIWSQRAVPRQIMEKEALKGKGKTILRQLVPTGLRSKLFAIRVVSAWNKPPEEVGDVGSVREFKGRLDNVWLSVFGAESA